jgi:uncharacterized membrane protein YadS
MCFSSLQPPLQNKDDENKKKTKVPSGLSSVLMQRIPGIALAATTAGAGVIAANYLGQALLHSQGITGGSSPISGIPVAILFGLALNNTIKLPKETFEAGLKFCSTTALRLGIVCVGAKLSVIDIMATGTAGIPVVVSSIAAGLLFIPWAAKKANLPPRYRSVAVQLSQCVF